MKVSIAYVSKPRGFKGELAVIPYKDDTQTISEGLEVTLQKGDDSRVSLIESIKYLNGRLAVKFEGIDDEASALSWRGAEILVELENLSALNENEFYHFDIEGSEVFEEGGEYLGKVTGIESIAANDVLKVSGDKGEILIPFVRYIVVEINTKLKKMIIRKIEGLY